MCRFLPRALAWRVLGGCFPRVPLDNSTGWLKVTAWVLALACPAPLPGDSGAVLSPTSWSHHRAVVEIRLTPWLRGGRMFEDISRAWLVVSCPPLWPVLSQATPIYFSGGSGHNSDYNVCQLSAPCLGVYFLLIPPHILNTFIVPGTEQGFHKCVQYSNIIFGINISNFL